MVDWHKYVQRDIPLPEWTYPIRYENERIIKTDALILGGGIAGCHAAINARRKGITVAVIEKGATKWSGSGGAGVDHWLAACTNPCSIITPEEYTTVGLQSNGGYDCGALRYVACRESWDALLDCEQMGMQIRDVNDEFKGADFRDNKTKLLFAYDYKNKVALRVYGHNVKPLLYREMKRLGVEIHDRVMVTSLLTTDSEQTSKVIGATGINMRTGEFLIYQAKATVIATGLPGRIWAFSTELRPAFRDFNNVGDGCAIAWNAGAEFANTEQSFTDSVAFSYLEYGMGNTSNTWYGCPIVDANGKEVPWFDRDGNQLDTLAERFLPSPGQKFMIGQGERVQSDYSNQVKSPAPDFAGRIKNGEFILPLYADLSRLPEQERRAIFGLMVGNEGKTRIPVYDTLTKSGFDPNRDLLQAPVMPPEGYRQTNYWAGLDVPHWRIWGTGGLVVNWDLRTNLEGLYAAGGAVFGSGAHSSAAASGRYVGRKIAAYVKTVDLPMPDRHQVEKEKVRVYAPLRENNHNIGWKELNAGICRIMQDHCGQYRSHETLVNGLRLMKELRESEATMLHASTPHELGRALECHTIMTVGEISMQASLARKASSNYLNFFRLDYPALDPSDWQKLIPIKQVSGRVEGGELPFDYHLRPPNAPTYQENYRLHCES
jgi:succinate dehydrogenase/fumarate reductase flavoprotein subunit